MSADANKYATINAGLVALEDGTHGWQFAVSSPESAMVATGGAYKSRAGAVVEAIPRASALRLQVPPDVLALLLATDEPGVCRPTFHLSGFGTAPDAPSLRCPAASEANWSRCLKEG